ncbi:glutamine amidotransferase [Halomonas huangheensis]|nr:glutamine amidotransferase [Halomonas huangheensis]ALM54818.1 glutamine amidotransferase [Halomonas huangheensis]
MHIHMLQHQPHQGPARIADWLTSMGHSYTIFHLHQRELVPRISDCDALIVLDDHEDNEQQSWSRAERKLIDQALDGQKPLLGIGTGALRIAELLGAPVGHGTNAEVGWQHINLASDSSFDLPDDFTALLWHRQVFGLPDDALPLGGSETSPVLGFAWDAGRVVGLACQLHHHRQSLAAQVESVPAPAGYDDSPWVQSSEAILAEAHHVDELAPLLDRVLSQWLRTAAAT